jgi:hypothetical protein
VEACLPRPPQKIESLNLLYLLLIFTKRTPSVHMYTCTYTRFAGAWFYFVLTVDVKRGTSPTNIVDVEGDGVTVTMSMQEV